MNRGGIQDASIITIAGANSGYKVELSVDTLVTLLEWYVRDAPKEVRTLKMFSTVILMFQEIKELVDRENDATEEYISKKLKGQAKEEYLDGTEDQN